MEEIHGRGFVSCMECHLVWSTKYRRKVITDEIGVAIRDIFTETAPKFHAKALEFDHCEVYNVKQMKGASARILFQQFLNIKRKLWGENLWNPSDFIATVSDRTEEPVARYIKSQREKK